jgi:GntR family transcriptional regulator
MITEIKILLDFRNKIPISEQVQKGMRSLIQNGLLQPGDQLPTVRVLATQLKVNFNTIARAYRALDQEGWISTQQGRGTYVLETDIPEEKLTLTKEQRVDQLLNELFEKASELNIDPDDLQQALLIRLQTKDQKKQPARKRSIHKQLKKRTFTPAGDLGWVKSRLNPTLKKLRRIRRSE